MGFSFYAVSKFHSFMLSSLIVLCSNNMKGIAKKDTTKYLQEFLVKGSDLTSAKSQQGTKAEKRTLVSKSSHPVIGLI